MERERKGKGREEDGKEDALLSDFLATPMTCCDAV